MFAASRRSRFLAQVLPLGLLLALLTRPLAAAEPPPEQQFRAATRGFGQVQVTLRPSGDQGEQSWTSFATEDAAHATLCAAKRLADLLGFGDLKIVADSGLPGTVLALGDDHWWLLGTSGDVFHELYAPSKRALTRLARSSNAATWQAVTPHAYPRWLDCFDNAGPGVWVGGGGDQYVLPSDFEWLQARKLTMCTLSPTESRLVGPGVLDTSIFDWHTAMAAKYDLPYRVLHFPAPLEWVWNREPLPYVRPEPGRTMSAPWLDYQKNTCADAVEPVPALDAYKADSRRRLAAHLVTDPNYVGMHGCTEIPDAGVDALAAILDTPGTQALWHGYLTTELGMDLATVGQLHHGDRHFFSSWEAVPVPRPADFIGWNPATCMDLRGTWELHEDTARAGHAAGWFDPAKAPADWVSGNCNDPLIQLYTPHRSSKPEEQPEFWMRRTLTVAAGQRATLTYLHFARDVYHGNHTPMFDVWLNGQKLAPLSAERGDFDQCFVVGEALREGANQLVLATHGTPIPGYAFLGPVPLRRYPHMTAPENRLWFDAVNFDAWLRVGKIESQLRATRAADPDRPLKLMALINLLDLSTPLCTKYGAYQHDTGGAGGYWAPMTGARLARSHGLPFSCEQGGPPHTAADMQSAMTFYLMYGNDAVDLVFAASHYRDKPDVSAWFDQHLELIHCIGKLHLPPPAIAVLRSTRATRLGFDEPWNWDIARGPLQSAGRNFVYVEVPDLLNGTADQYPVVIDDGTVLLTDEDIAGIKRYVRGGGTFVAQHHTGRHSPEQADSWALAKAWGLTVAPSYMTDQNYHKWPLAKLSFAAGQTLLPSLRGQTIEGSGVAVDYLGREHSGAVSLSGQGANIVPVATWEDGSMAIAEVHAGRGRFILLGTPFYTRMRDVKGIWVNDVQRTAWLDEFLTALGAPRDSWTGGAAWAEIWRSKNGVYDLYPVARMSRDGDAVTPVTATLRRATPPSGLVEMSALGHPAIKATWKDGQFTLPTTDYSHLESRVYAAPRADLAHGAYDWFRTQADLWRALPPLPAIRQPQTIAVPADLLPLADGWTMQIEGQPDRVVTLGAYGTLGVPENTVATFVRQVPLPAAWKGQRVELVFNAEGWFWGILPQAQLQINGQDAALKQPLKPEANPGFAIDVTAAAATGTLTLSLKVDGTSPANIRKDKAGAFKPAGITGLFYLQTAPKEVQSAPLAGPWLVASAFNRLAPTQPGAQVKGLYLETRFTLPAIWPAKHVAIEAPVHLGFLVINGQVLMAPAWMKHLDISGLVLPAGGENVLRWIPSARDIAGWNRPYQGVVPELKLVWTD